MLIWKFCNNFKIKLLLMILFFECPFYVVANQHPIGFHNKSSWIPKTVDPQLLKAAQGMEALFLNEMWKVMRQTIPKSEISLDSSATQIYQSLIDEEYSQVAVRRGGVGLAQQLIAYFYLNGYNKKRGQRVAQGDAMKVTNNVYPNQEELKTNHLRSSTLDSKVIKKTPQEKKAYFNQDVKSQISPQSKEFAQVKNLATKVPDIREERVHALKQKIDQGHYSVPAEEIADRLVDEHLRSVHDEM